MRKRTIIATVSTVAGIYILNALLLFFFQPVSTQFDEYKSVTKTVSFGDIRILTVRNLHSGGVGGWSAEAGGYVNMLSAEEIIYINPDIEPDNFNQTSYLYRHEFTHLMEKQVVAKASGGYPSMWNPITSAVYYYNLIRLNNDLEHLMPSVNEKTRGFVPAKGLEAAAECYAQPHSSLEEPPLYYKAPYIFPRYCNAEQVEIASRLFSGKWPRALTHQEISDLEPVHITTKQQK